MSAAAACPGAEPRKAAALPRAGTPARLPALALPTLALLALAMGGPAAAADRDGNFAVWGPGSVSCHRYAQDRGKDAFRPYQHYLMGYLSFYNQSSEDTYSVTAELDLPEVMRQLDALCAEEPLYSFHDALRTLTQEMHERRWRKAPRAQGRSAGN